MYIIVIHKRKKTNESKIDVYTFALLNRRLYNPEIAKGDLSDIKGDLSVAK
jgi:hypothetical protein